MLIKRSLLTVYCTLLIASITGCDYLRLLQFKAQLRNFDRYFQLAAQAGLALICLEPVLLPEDILVIMEDEPTNEIMKNHQEHWMYRFQKRYIRGQEELQNFDFTQTLVFEQGKLSLMRYSSPFFDVFPPSILKMILQGIGRGTFEQETEQIVFHWNARELALPTRQQIQEVWGAPYSIIPTESGQQDLYVYTLRSSKKSSDATKSVLQILLTFRSEDQELLSIRGWYKSASWEIYFDEPYHGVFHVNL
jgi:hypothetical protein